MRRTKKGAGDSGGFVLECGIVIYGDRERERERGRIEEMR
jgi:hypothetical protein